MYITRSRCSAISRPARETYLGPKTDGVAAVLHNVHFEGLLSNCRARTMQGGAQNSPGTLLDAACRCLKQPMRLQKGTTTSSNEYVYDNSAG